MNSVYSLQRLSSVTLLRPICAFKKQGAYLKGVPADVHVQDLAQEIITGVKDPADSDSLFPRPFSSIYKVGSAVFAFPKLLYPQKASHATLIKIAQFLGYFSQLGFSIKEAAECCSFPVKFSKTLQGVQKFSQGALGSVFLSVPKIAASLILGGCAVAVLASKKAMKHEKMLAGLKLSVIIMNLAMTIFFIAAPLCVVGLAVVTCLYLLAKLTYRIAELIAKRELRLIREK